jgi:murein DD-endopeptidase MepM/ murein hydrolase activator NlpD
MFEDYRGDFATLAQVKEFLELVKESADEENQYEAVMMSYDSQIDGIMCAGLQTRNKTEDAAEPVTAGFCRNLTEKLEDAADVSDGNYQTGLLAMEFVEEVYVYQNYVDADALCDVKEEAQEVTKEKESNKIYIVEQGECLSVIALDQGTTVASIVALNGLENADNIREGQELIIAVPEPDLKLRVTMGVVYEEDYNEEAVIIPNDDWYTTHEVVLQEGTTGHRERNDKIVYENGIETSREMIYENIMIPSTAAVIERGTIIPPTYIKPISGGVFSSGYGPRWGRTHKGVDWACAVGTTVFASSAGTVIQAAYSSSYGYNVVLSHPDGRMTRYAHCSKLLVQVGDYVEQGDTLALSGNTGDSTGPHLHFELYIGGSTVNPLDYIGY